MMPLKTPLAPGAKGGLLGLALAILLPLILFALVFGLIRWAMLPILS